MKRKPKSDRIKQELTFIAATQDRTMQTKQSTTNELAEEIGAFCKLMESDGIAGIDIAGALGLAWVSKLKQMGFTRTQITAQIAAVSEAIRHGRNYTRRQI